MGWFGVPVLAAMAVWSSGTGLPGSWDAAHERGTPGTFTALRKDCGKICSFYGDFVSDDGSTRFHDVLFEDRGILAVGDQVEAIDSGTRGPTVVYALHGSRTWIIVVLLITTGALALVCWGLALLNALRGGKPLLGERCESAGLTWPDAASGR